MGGRSHSTILGSTPTRRQARRCEMSCSRIAFNAAARRSACVVNSFPAIPSTRGCPTSYRPAAACAWHSLLPATASWQRQRPPLLGHRCAISGCAVHAAIHRFVLVQGALAQAVFTSHLSSRHPRFLLFDHPSNLELGKTALSHLFTSLKGRANSILNPGSFAGGQVTSE